MVNCLAVAELRGQPRLEPEEVAEPERHRALEEGGHLAVRDLDRLVVALVPRLDRRQLDLVDVDLVGSEL
jgi:hypothetical protein